MYLRFCLRRISTFLMITAVLTTTLSAQNTVYIADGAGSPCDTGVVIPVSLSNTIPVKSFVFKIVFNDRILIATRVESTSRTANFEFSGLVGMFGWLRFEGVAPEGDPLEIGEGTIANLVFNVNCAANLGDSTSISWVPESCSVLDTLGVQLPELQFEDGLFVVTAPGVWDESYADKPVAQTVLTNYPNPFIRSTTISFSVPNSRRYSRIYVDIFDPSGRWVVHFPINSEDGTGSFQWHGMDNKGIEVPSGRYIYRLYCVDSKGSVISISHPMILLR